jgi:hypothetical protein
LVEEKVVEAVGVSNARELKVERRIVFAEPIVVLKGKAVNVEVGSVLTDTVNEDAAVVVGEIEL